MAENDPKREAEKAQAEQKAEFADKDYDGYSLKDAEKDGWRVSLKQDPRVISADGAGVRTELVVEEGKWLAEKTFDGHLITAFGRDEETLAAAIASQQASIDSAPGAAPVPGPIVLNDQAGGEENEGLGGVLPELQVKRDETGDVQVVAP